MPACAPQTACQTFGNATNCNTQPDFSRLAQVGVDQAYRDPFQAQQQGVSMEMEREQAMLDAQHVHEAFAKQAAESFMDGDCDGALTIAFNGGVIVLAKRFRDYCRSANH